MTDDQIERLILEQIRKKDVTYLDMKSPPDVGIDPNPDDKATPPSEKGIRKNRFINFFGCDRMKEILCVSRYSPYSDSVTLLISFQDLFRFWWNRCVVQEYVVDDVLEDIYEYFTCLMAPPDKEKEEPEIEVDFDKMSFLSKPLEAAA